MNKLEIKNLVKEAIQEIKQENLQQEGKLGRILGGAAFVAALLAGNAKLDQSFYKNDPQIIQLEKDLHKLHCYLYRMNVMIHLYLQIFGII